MPLRQQVDALVLVELVVVHDGIIKQPPGEPPAQRLVAQLFALGDRFRDQPSEPVGKGLGRHGRRPAGARQQHAQHRPVHVVEDVGPGGQVRVLVPGDPAQHPPAEQQPDDRDQIGPVRPAVQGQREPGSGQLRLGGGRQYFVGEAAERGLRSGVGECREGQAQRDVPAPAEWLLVVPAHWVRRVRQRRGGLEQPGGLRVRGETPSGLAVQPVPQLGQVPPDQDQRLAVGISNQQRPGQQSAQRGPALCLLLSRDHDTLAAQGP